MIWSVGISGEFDTELCPIAPTGAGQPWNFKPGVRPMTSVEALFIVHQQTNRSRREGGYRRRRNSAQAFFDDASSGSTLDRRGRRHDRSNRRNHRLAAFHLLEVATEKEICLETRYRLVERRTSVP